MLEICELAQFTELQTKAQLLYTSGLIEGEIGSIFNVDGFQYELKDERGEF